MNAPVSILMPEKRRSFSAASPGEARAAASAWLGNFDEHGPLAIRSIRVDQEGEDFVAVVTYRDTRIEISPRYFDSVPPFARSA